MAKFLRFLVIIALPASSYANNAEWFTALKVSIGEAAISDISHGGTIGTGAPLEGFIDGQIESRETYDYTAGMGLAVGRRFGNWTIEGEYVYRYRTDWDIAAPTPSIATVTNVFSDVETQTLIINLVRRGAISRHWSWEIGAGIGLVVNDIEAEYLERATPTTGELLFEDNSRENDFTYNVLAGVTRELGGPWTLNLRYRYIDLGDMHAGPFPDRPARVVADHHSHELQISLEFEL